MIVGIDLGNYAVKNSKGISFLSKISKDGGIEENGDFIVLDDEKFYLGEGEFDTEYRKSYKKSLLPLLFGSVALTTDDTINQLVVGLPLSQFKEDKEYLRNRILQNSRKEVIINDVPKKIIIDDIEIVPEGVGAVPQKFEGVVIDIGGRTTDICLIVNESGKRKIKKPYSMAKGMLNLESDYINCINRKYGLDLMQNDTERLLSNGLKIYGEEQDITFAMEIYKTFVDTLISQIQVDYPIKTYDIALVGGGAKKLYKPIKKRLPNSFLVENSFFANAEGYERIGKNIWL